MTAPGPIATSVLPSFGTPKADALAGQTLHLDISDLAAETVVYAVSDIHGMHRLLQRLLVEIEADSTSRGKSATVVFLGDMVNRGPDTKGVLETLLRGPPRHHRWICLRGNHEQAFLGAFEDDRVFQKFLRKGGLATMMSYDDSRKAISRNRLRSCVPPEHRAFLRALPLTCRARDLLFVHAGVEPGKPLEFQSQEALLNIREPFFNNPHGLPYTVVHGHTPSSGKPVVAEGRICLDTGAVMTGVLTAGVFEKGCGARFISVRRSGTRIA